MPLKYANPEEAKTLAYQYYNACIDKHNRTNAIKDHQEMVRARKDYQNKAQYARNHQGDVQDPNKSLSLVIQELEAQRDTLREKNSQLRRALTIANRQLATPVDQRDPKVLHNLRKIEHDRFYSGE